MAKGGSSSNSAPAQQTVTQSNEPSSIAKPHYEKLFSTAESIYDTSNKLPYSGPLVAGPTDQQKTALNWTQDIAGNLSDRAAPVIQYANDVASGKYLDPGSNPYLMPGINAALEPVTRRYSESILPQITASAHANDAFGGGREDLLRLAAGRDFAGEANNIAAKIGYDNYLAERGRMDSLPQLISAGTQLELAAPQLLSQVGATQQGWDQTAIDEAIAKFQAEKAAPWEALAPYAQIVTSGNPGQTSTGTTLAMPGGNSRTSNAIMGALGGGIGVPALALGLGATSGGAALIPWALGGAAAGGLGGFFG